MLNANHDSTEVMIGGTIEGVQRMTSIHKDQGEGEKERDATTEEVIEISFAAKRHWELQIRTLQEAPRDPEKLREILKVKQMEYEKAEDSEDIDRLVSEIEMLKFALYLVCRT
jgi:hypothetical protein